MKPAFRPWWWHVPLLIAAVTFLLPLLFMFATALTVPGEALRPAHSVWSMVVPKTWRWENFAEVWRVVPFFRYYLNSLFVSGVMTIGQVFTSACAAYAFARLEWPGRDRLFFAYLATMMVPGAVTMIPNFVVLRMLPEWFDQLLPFVQWGEYRYLGHGADAPGVGRLLGLDSYFTLIVPGMFSAYGTFLLRQFMLSLPREIDEAAKIDGCGYWRLFSRIILPLSLPGLATLTIFTFIGSWASLLWPLVTTNSDALRTLPLGLQAFQGQYGAEWHLMMAAALLMLLPIIAIFLLGQKYFVQGLTVGAVKG